MAGYRRFIAYVYEYRKGKKQNNCGFIKVEVRGNGCVAEIHLQVEGLAEGEECKVYCFVRKEGLLHGILIGSCNTKKDWIECVLETDGTSIGGSGLPLDKMGGMIRQSARRILKRWRLQQKNAVCKKPKQEKHSNKRT